LATEGSNTLIINAAKSEEIDNIRTYLAKEVTTLEVQSEGDAGKSIKMGFKPEVVAKWEENALTQALLTIRNRIDQFGVTEPVIQRQGKDRIIIELAGEKDPDRAIKILGTTAELRFQLVKDFASTKEALLAKYNNKTPEGQQILPAAAVEGSTDPRGFYLLDKEAKVTGANLKDARVSSDEMNLPAVSFELDRTGAKAFSTLTEANIGSPLAIVLDDIVQTAPVIKSRIPDGSGQITGIGSANEANDTALVLRAGALPAPIIILEKLGVGPSLGEDSIRAGMRAAFIGAAIVFVFMLIYYKASGIIADIALAFNVVLIMASLAYFRATLTLPGIAGIALTVGMAVDNNILIFERIKEELRIGKTYRSATENGYKRAIVTILDANLTTLLTGVILFQFGTGSVKGFAVTLSIGIISTLFTAVIVSKVLTDLILKNTQIKLISI
jgi:preprotein translocase subunit SecD